MDSMLILSGETSSVSAAREGKGSARDESMAGKMEKGGIFMVGR